MVKHRHTGLKNTLKDTPTDSNVIEKSNMDGGVVSHFLSNPLDRIQEFWCPECF